MAEKNKTVRMVAKISGSRDGKDWPNPGEKITLPEAEADQLLVNGMAVLPDTPETATLSGATETATTRGNQSLRQSAAQAKADADAQAAAKAQADADAAAAAQKVLDDQAEKSAADAEAEQKAAAEAEKKAAAKK
ncbi:hypothetical protein [Arthrobacter sp. 18067]|uniref:hypothetical protein n=1 Tax=Arthrobacter sp. 18067 TaxID=2681413 RepID=UPI00135BFB26|nr:hypothetical protein [Arthrobacter sp. 18067]